MKRPFSLSPRLKAAAELVPVGSRLADVGTDHGRLPVWLIQHKVTQYAVASDLRSGPLNKARALAARWGVSDQISFRLCDGLSGISPQEAETVTITGMGGETIAHILDAAAWTREGTHRYILQPMSGIDALRDYLSGHGFCILQEILVPEGNTLYVILLAQPGEMPPLTQGEIWVGRQSRGEIAPLRSKYLDQELQKLHRAVAGLQRSQRLADQEKQSQYSQMIQEVTEMKREWETWQQ